MSQLRAVLWDMDGTLIDSEKVWTVALEELMVRFGAGLSDATREAMIGSNMRHSSLLLLAEAGIEPTPEAMADVESWLNERMKVLLRGPLPWRPGALEALRSVRQAGIRTALVTSTERMLTEISLDSIGREFFDVTVCGDEVDGQNKPLPRPYQLAAQLLGVDPGDCVAVEDSVAGVTSAAAAGCTVLVVPAEAPVPPGERRVLRESLVGVDAELLARLLTVAPGPDGAARDGTIAW
ncbi:MAG TPA: HAD family phosphatase [Pseudonocardiaceae bacterium]|nr:HAD family phosphatase [Pseudonocardiaceae bacterium]